LFLRINQRGKEVSAEWWDETWMYRQSINISSHNSDESNVFITTTIGLGSTAKAQTDAGDFRFLNSTGQILPYYIVSGAGTTSITFHINLDSFPAGAQTLYAYYGNPSATNGFSAADFSPEASNYTLGSLGTEEVGGGPIAHWKFDEGIGTTAFDSSSNQYNSPITGATWQNEDQCITGKCLSFNGTNNYLSTNFGNGRNLTDNPITISTWVKPIGIGNTIMFIGTDNGTNQRLYLAIYNGKWDMGIQSSTWGSPGANVNVDFNKWAHVTLVMDGSNAKLYVNGRFSFEKTYTSYSLASNIAIGRYGSSSAYYWPGLIDEVKIFPYARTESQIKADYTAGLAGMSTSSDSSVNIGGASSGKSLSDGLVGYWKMDEGVGETSADSSGNNFMATFSGSTLPTWSNGKYGNASQFNGINSYIRVPSNTIINHSTNGTFSLSVWVKPSTLSSSWRRGIIRQESYLNSGFRFGFLNGGAPIFWTDQSGGTLTMFSSTPMILNQWNHLAVTYNNQQGILYQNGNKVANATGTYIAGSNDFNIGYIVSEYFEGNLDEVRIYNRALSPTEVKQLYEFAPGPITYWTFENSNGDTLPDISGNGYDGILNGNFTFTSGKIGKSIDLDGSTAYVSTTTNTPKNMKDYTYTFWMKIEGDGAAGYNSTIYRVNGGGTNRLMINNSNKQILFQFPGSSDYGTYYNFTFSYNSWYHISFVKSIIDNGYKLYVNGTYVGSKGIVESDGGSGSFYLGYGGTERFNGKIDEFKIYNYARTQKQILQDMEATTPVGASAKVGQPIAYYKFDEGIGTTTANWGIGGTSLNGTFGTGTSAPSWGNGKINKALSFDGNDYLTIPDDTSFNLEQNFSISGWFKTSATGVRTGIFYLPAGGYVSIFVHSTNAFYFETRDNNNAYLGVSSGSYHDGQWHHFVASRDDYNDKLNIYIDGSLINSVSDTRTGSFNSTSGPYIGRDSSDFKFNGLIDEIKIYNYALSADEIKQDYNQSSSFVFGTTSQTIGATTTNLEYCAPGSTDHCAPPVGEWKFDEGIGTTAYDISGNNNHAVFATGSSAPSWTTGKIGKGVSLNTNKYLNAGSNSSLDLSGPLTVQTWVKPDVGTGQQGIIGNSVFQSPFGLYLRHSPGSDIGFWVNPDGNRHYMMAGTINYGSWNHIAGTWDGTNLLLYLNGQLISNSITSGTYTRTFNDLIFGKVNGIASPVYLDGLIDQVRIYNYARTPAQIAYDYNKGEPVGWWKMDECQGTLINDWSGNSNHGTLSIGASGTQTSPGTCTTSGSWANGKLGKLNASLNFDGSDDTLLIGDPSNGSLDFGSGPFSYGVWVYSPLSAGSWDMPIYKGGSSATNPGYDMELGTSGWGAYVGDGTSSYSVTLGPETLNQWVHLFVVVDRQNNQLLGYKNGKVIGTTNISTLGSTSSSNSLYISHNTYRFNGQIDDVRIYNYALTPTQIKTIYNGGSVNFR
jgi:hypothetical protein